MQLISDETLKGMRVGVWEWGGTDIHPSTLNPCIFERFSMRTSTAL